ncbi:unnamed protein product [Larinioides sclopetarius]|uniref:GTP-binding protein n=1 Tax=Larinioides sclopetarius TaxID=280406 RepID=A0AAV2BHU8_9ARAC
MSRSMPSSLFSAMPSSMPSRMSSSMSISMREEKSPKKLDFMRDLAKSKIFTLKPLAVCVIGDEETGRRTLIRRFLNMDDGPFQHPENREDTTRNFMVNLTDRPNVIGRGYVYLYTFIFNLQKLDFETIFEKVGCSKTFLVIFDVGRGSTLHTAIHCLVKITETLRRRTPEFILVGNKVDLPQREVSAERGREIAEMFKAERYYECSALMNINMNAVLDAVLVMALDQFIPLPP